MKKIISLVLFMSIFINIATIRDIAYAADVEYENSDINLIVNDKKITFPDQQPIVKDGRTYVPVRFLAEALGATVEWDNEL